MRELVLIMESKDIFREKMAQRMALFPKKQRVVKTRTKGPNNYFDKKRPQSKWLKIHTDSL